MKEFLDNVIEMPDKLIALVIRSLEQGNGKLSERYILCFIYISIAHRKLIPIFQFYYKK